MSDAPATKATSRASASMRSANICLLKTSRQSGKKKEKNRATPPMRGIGSTVYLALRWHIHDTHAACDLADERGEEKGGQESQEKCEDDGGHLIEVRDTGFHFFRT